MRRTCPQLGRKLWEEAKHLSLVQKTRPTPVPLKDAGYEIQVKVAERGPTRVKGSYGTLIAKDAMINKTHKNSIEVVRYNGVNETTMDEEGKVPARELPGNELTLRSDPFKEDRIAKIKEGKSLSISYANPYHIPDVLRGTDQCPGCGSLMQCREEFKSGYTSLESIKLHIENHDRMMKLRERYYLRQEKLHENIKTSGFQEGMEYQDYITEEELQAVHQYHPSPVICERCLHIGSYSYDSCKNMMPSSEWVDELMEIREKNCVVVLVVSLWDFEGTFLTDIRNTIGPKKIVMVGTHADAIPIPWVLKGTEFWAEVKTGGKMSEKWNEKHLGLLGTWMKKRAKMANIKVQDAIAVGNQQNQNIDLVAAAIEHWRKPDEEVYLVGAANVGKSSLLNNLISRYTVAAPPHPAAELVTDIVRKNGKIEYTKRWKIPEEAAPIEKALSLTIDNVFSSPVQTVSDIPGTTIKNIKLDISTSRGKSRIHDTPGVITKNSIANVLPLGIASMVTPKQRSHLDFFKVAPGDSLFVSAMVRVDVVKGPPEGVLLKAVARWNRLTTRIERTATADVFYEKWKGIKTVLSPPSTRPMLDTLGGLVEETVVYIGVGETPKDICVNGLFFFSPTPCDQGVVFKIHTVKGLRVVTRPSIYDLRNIHPPRKLFRGRKKSRAEADPFLVKMVSDTYGIMPEMKRTKRVETTPFIEENDDDDDDEGETAGLL